MAKESVERDTDMLRRSVTRTLRFSPERLFDLAADVERYPEFFPGWIAARVRRRDGEECWTEQTLGLGPLRVQVTTRSVLHRPQWIEVTSDQSPFRRFALTWRFAPADPSGCRVELTVEMELDSVVLGKLAQRFLPVLAEEALDALESRAADLDANPGRERAMPH